MASPRPSRRSSNERAWLVTGPLALLAAVCCTGLALLGPPPPGNLAIVGVLLLAMVAAGTQVLQFVIRRQALAFTITEIPLVLAFFYLPPLMVVAIASVAALIGQLRRRLTPTKIWFNVAKAAAAASLACLVLLALPDPQGVGPRTWLTLFLTVSTNTLVTLAAVSGVIGVLQGWQAGWEVVSSAPQPLATSAINVIIGLVVLIALETTWWSLLLIAVLAVAVVLIYRSYSQFFRQHRTLGDMYELTRAITASGQDGNLADVLLARIRSMMQAEYATLWLPAQGRHPEVMLTARVDDNGLLDVAPTPTALREEARRRGGTVALGVRLGGEDDLRAALRHTGIKDVIVVPLRSGQAVIGTLEVANRLSDVGHFTTGDIPVFETVAAHAAVALENSRLVDRLRHDAYHDALTKLPNRRRITGALDEAVKIRAPGEVVAVLLFDVNGLRQVNESLGHAAGDKVLAEVADRLRASAPSSALVGRAGGDEFLVTLRLENAEAALEARRRAARADPRRDGLRLADPRRGHRRRGGRTPGSRQRCRDPAATGRPGRDGGQVGARQRAAVQPGAGVPVAAPPRPRRRPAARPGRG